LSEKEEDPADSTLYDRLKRSLRNRWIFALVSLVAGGAVFAGDLLKAVKEIGDFLSPPKPRITMFATIGKGGGCNFYYFDDSGMEQEMQQMSVIDVAINNSSDGNILLTSVRIVPGWVTGSLFAGELRPTKQYDVDVSRWLAMAEAAQGYQFRPSGEFDIGSAIKWTPRSIWWTLADSSYDLPAETVEEYALRTERSNEGPRANRKGQQ